MMHRPSRMVVLCVGVPLFAAACDPAERRADEVVELRDRATAGIEAVEAFCTLRDSVVARAERGEPGVERALEEVLLAPVVLDDYCAEFRFHSHDEGDEGAGPPPSDTMKSGGG